MTTHNPDGAFLAALMSGYHFGVEQGERPLSEMIQRLDNSTGRLIRARMGAEEWVGNMTDASVIFDAAGLVKAIRRESEPAGRVASQLFDQIAEVVYSGTRAVYAAVWPLLDLGRAFVRSDEAPAA
ncbi:hypothetical protein [Streptomyces sp. NPDC001601]|uniref:hypothetical protein n=1 Tax=Streptomyces sp. NPDC001601 TaxID=3364592 RepID=UPI0036737D2B